MAPEDWIGRERTIHDAMDPWAAAALISALPLDRPAPAAGDPLPPFWHWMYFREAARRAALGPDGHPATGGFMPAVAEPRRMWAGGRFEVHGPLPLGHPATRIERIEAVSRKEGRSGPLTFVTVSHRIEGASGLAFTEAQDIVYRTDPDPAEPRPEPRQARRDEAFRQHWVCDATVLFRYSALTYNGHRIHYDQSWAREVEGYPGLVVHGPLLATLLLEAAAELRPGSSIHTFSFRAVTPIFEGERFAACARPAGALGTDLWIRGADGRLAMVAEVRNTTSG